MLTHRWARKLLSLGLVLDSTSSYFWRMSIPSLNSFSLTVRLRCRLDKKMTNSKPGRYQDQGLDYASQHANHNGPAKSFFYYHDQVTSIHPVTILQHVESRAQMEHTYCCYFSMTLPCIFGHIFGSR